MLFEKIIEWKKTPLVYLGRNGIGACLGIDIWMSPGGHKVNLSPINSKGDVARCRIEIPEGSIREIANILLELADNLPRKFIGYQVVNGQMEIHPNMDASFCVYNHSQAKEMLEPGYHLVSIYEGDIEEPTFMYDGDPRQ